jgi:NADPH:quinone reductase-like Zn-dependent oxidoreductase
MENFTTQKVVVSEFGSPDVLKLENKLPEFDPEKGPLIEIWAVGVGYADIMAQRGGYFLAPKRPFSPGYDFVGRVVDTNNSKKVKEGDMVAAMLPTMCTYQDKLQAPEDYLVKLHEDIKTVDAAASVLNYLTAYCILEEKAKVKEGDTVLIHGVSGGVGTALAQIGQQKKLKMYGTCSAAKFHLAEKYGVTPIDYKNESFEGIIKKTNLHGIDAAFDAMGAENLKKTARVIKRGGTIVSYGFSGSNYGGYGELFKGLLQFLKIKLFPNGIKMKACGTPAEIKKNPDWYRKTLNLILNQIKEGKLNPVVDSVFPLDQVSKAHAHMESGKATGKVVLTTKYFEE